MFVFFVFLGGCFLLLLVLRGHSIFSSPQQRPMTSIFKGSLPQILFITLFSYLNSWERASNSHLMLSAEQGNSWYHFYNVFGMTQSLTGDWTLDLQHWTPALYHKAAEEALTLCEIPYLSGSIPWFFTAELFTQGPRSAAVSMGVLVNWAANAVVGISYPFLEVLYFEVYRHSASSRHLCCLVWQYFNPFLQCHEHCSLHNLLIQFD